MQYDPCPNCGHDMSAHNLLMGTCEENELPDPDEEELVYLVGIDEDGNEWVYLEDTDGPMLFQS